jgi:hypothetical protein
MNFAHRKEPPVTPAGLAHRSLMVGVWRSPRRASRLKSISFPSLLFHLIGDAVKQQSEPVVSSPFSQFTTPFYLALELGQHFEKICFHGS